MTDHTKLAYLGPVGAGLGFRMGGMDVVECTDTATCLRNLRELVEQRIHGIIFVDEGLAEPVFAEVERLNANALPAIVLLPNPTQPKHLAREKIKQLVMQAVGSDILNT